MQEAFEGRLFVAYIAPPSIEVLRARLGNDGRDPDGSRLRAAAAELASHENGEFAPFCDLEIVSHDGWIAELAERTHAAYTRSLS